MSIIRRCDICNGDITINEKYKTIVNKSNDVFIDDVDICPTCWVMLLDTVRAKRQRREEAKEADKTFSDPWDPSMMVVQRRD